MSISTTFEQAMLANAADLFGPRAGIRCAYTGVWLRRPLTAAEHARVIVDDVRASTAFVPYGHGTKKLTRREVLAQFSKGGES